MSPLNHKSDTLNPILVQLADRSLLWVDGRRSYRPAPSEGLGALRQSCLVDVGAGLEPVPPFIGLVNIHWRPGDLVWVQTHRCSADLSASRYPVRPVLGLFNDYEVATVLGPSTAEFAQAAQYVLNKNTELYQRLA